MNLDNLFLEKPISIINSDCIEKVSLDRAYELGINMLNNYHYSCGTNLPLSFLDHKIDMASFNVEDNKIKNIEFVFEFSESEVEFFFKNVVAKYGLPETFSLSKKYLEQYGYKNLIQDSVVSNENIRKPEINDYKNLKSLSWFNLRTSSSNSRAQLSILCFQPNQFFSDSMYYKLKVRLISRNLAFSEEH